MKELLEIACAHLEQGTPVALARVVAHKGSAPRGTGSRLLAGVQGLLAGTVGGGLAEAKTLEACQQALAEGTARILDFSLTGMLAAKSDMICGGTLRVLVEPFFPATAPLALYKALLAALTARGATLVTRLGSILPQGDATFQVTPVLVEHLGHSVLFPAAEPMGVPLAQETVAQLMAAVAPPQEAALCRVQGDEYFVDYFPPPLRMIIAGGGHVSRPTAQIAALAGFEVTVLDDRPEFAEASRFPWATAVHMTPEFAHCFAGLPITPRTYIVIVTRGHVHDASALAQALRTEAGYIGMIGSRRKKAEVYAGMRAMGFTDEDLARVCCPIGLDIRAETPEEIAVSIVGECIAHLRGARF
ncbi:XdhC family aldehyde oxidoreductase maturation factor [Desulfovibrio cuneatus]|uniref:XdhC family aldehyde oxidoreductase maturation factor n=1 Tax=Desulfovibrio cuneatus TaxID=159728 RepID=UPI0003FEB983|nr:XdhC/CoxI family protein [Desulfovibrio cuneatus]